jgi:hypothetical protein
VKSFEFVRAAMFGVGAGALIAAWSLVTGPVGTLAAVGLVLLILASSR